MAVGEPDYIVTYLHDGGTAGSLRTARAGAPQISPAEGGEMYNHRFSRSLLARCISYIH